jgi:hypothetical protein
MKPSSEARLQKLHPALVAALRRVVADLAAQGITIELVQGLRTFAEQDALFAKGRTQPGQIVTQARGGESNHNYGLAADLCPFTNDKPDWNAPITVWAAIGAAATAHGLDWGGAWKKFIDKPHVELPSITVKECLTCFRDGGLEAVWSTASKKVGWNGDLSAGAVPTARSLGMRTTRAARAVRTRSLEPSRAAKTIAPKKNGARKKKAARKR